MDFCYSFEQNGTRIELTDHYCVVGVEAFSRCADVVLQPLHKDWQAVGNAAVAIHAPRHTRTL
jgi:hypothetical protein